MKIYYCCYSTGDEVPSNTPEEFDKDTVISMASQILRDHKDFFGLISKNGATLQFYVEESGKVWAEVPEPKESGSYGKLISKEGIEPLLLELPEDFTKDSIAGLEFKAW